MKSSGIREFKQYKSLTWLQGNELFSVCIMPQVEKIVAKRKRQGRIEFLVKWRGYNSDENSWEPKENLAGCADAIRKFNRYEKEMRNSFSKTRV